MTNVTNETTNDSLTHFSEKGRARMVNVAEKTSTARSATASGILYMQPETLKRIRTHEVGKGNVLAVADVAAVMAAKKTSDTIPMCHPIGLSGVSVEFSDVHENQKVGIRAKITVHCSGQTGVEMEALCAVSAALLTIYDMCKSMDRGMNIGKMGLLEKIGGKSGHFLQTETEME